MNISDTDVLLIYPATGAKIINAPHAYLYIGASLKHAGFRPTIIDQRIEPDFTSALKEYFAHIRPLFAGLSSMTGFQIGNALKIARAVRDLSPNTPIVWGGVHPSLMPTQTVGHELVDIVVAGEGEQTAVELAAALRDSRAIDDIPGLITKSNAGAVKSPLDRPFINLDTNPPPDWSLVKLSDYITGYPTPGNIDLSTSRGCPHNCAFCYNQAYNRRRWRARGAESVLNEIEFLVREHRIRHIGFADDNFCVNHKRVESICDGLDARALKITFDCNVRADHLNESLAKRLAAAGCSLIYFGAESGSAPILNFINKETTIDRYLDAARLTLKYGIRPVFSFMIGVHSETPVDVKKSIALAKDLKRINPNALITDFKMYTPYPGTRMYEDSIRNGFKPPSSLEGWATFTFTNLHLPWIKNPSFVLSVSFTSLFANYYDQIKDNKLDPFTKTAMAILHKSAQFRWNHNFFSFPMEWKAVQFALNRMNR